MKRYQWMILVTAVIFILTALTELWMGRLPWGPDGNFGWWEGNIWSNENSQRVADLYSFTHIEHGLLFYGFLWLIAKKIPVQYRFLIALGLEAGWEILENSPLIIDRYRAVTISLGYVGDSVLNSLSDIVMMCIGYLAAYRLQVWMSITAFAVAEILLLFLIRDNLILNIIMLIYPIIAIKHWQMMGQPV